MVEIQKPKSTLKVPSLQRETVVVVTNNNNNSNNNNNAASTTPANTTIPALKKATITTNPATIMANEEELVAISPEERNWRGIFIALLVIAVVCSLIMFSIFLLSPEDETLRIRGRHIELSDILGKSLQWKSFNGTWTSDFELIYRDPTGGLSVLNLVNYTTKILMSNSMFVSKKEILAALTNTDMMRQLNAESFIVSPDQKYVLLQWDTSAEGSRYHVYDVITENTFPLGPSGNVAEAPRLQYVMWAPKSSHHPTAATTTTNSKQNSPEVPTSTLLTTLQNNPTTNTVTKIESLSSNMAASNADADISRYQAIAFVYENDLYYKSKVQSDVVCRVTSTGQTGVVFNGLPDWLYENVPELDNRQSSIAFSPDGFFLAFLTYNDSDVNEYKYTWMADDIKYPAVLTQRYPKTGDNNPNVTVNVVNLVTSKLVIPQQIRLPTKFFDNSYINDLTWATTTDLSFTVTNRAQTNASTVVCRAPAFQCHILHTEVPVEDGWVLTAQKPIFSSHIHASGWPQDNFNDNFENVTNGQMTYEISKGAYLLKRLPVRDGEHGHYRHVVLISSLDRRTVPLTMGRFEVTEILGWDVLNETVYFMAAPEKRPGERHLYKISLKLNVTKMNRTYVTTTQPTCLTCDNTAATFKLVEHRACDVEDCTYNIPNNCLYNKIYFSKDFSYYVQECLGPEAPSVYLVETRSNMKLFVLHAGDSLHHRLAQLALPQMRTFSVEIRHGFHAQVRLYLPPGMREEEEAVFPLILQVDAAPGSQLVSEKYQVDWNWYLCSQRSMIVAQIDGRGSGFQGEKLRSQVRGKLGTVEIEDQLGVLTYLRDSFKFIDPTRICAYGWDYGGYASAMVLIEDSQQVLQCSVAINPIVSFGYHYSFFTERYIPLKGDYLRALQEADLTMKAGNIKERNLMLIHGTADMLVHQEQTLMFVRALVEQEVKFRHQIYPDEDHAMTKSLSHVYKTMEWYFDECFGPNEDNDWDPTRLFMFKE